MGTSGKNSAYFFFFLHFNHYKLLWRETKVLHSALMFTGVLNLDWYWLSPPWCLSDCWPVHRGSNPFPLWPQARLTHARLSQWRNTIKTIKKKKKKIAASAICYNHHLSGCDEGWPRTRLCQNQPGRHGNRPSYLNTGARGRALTAPGWTGIDSNGGYPPNIWFLCLVISAHKSCPFEIPWLEA